MLCHCQNKVVLARLDTKNDIAREIYCMKHGYQTTCRMCNVHSIGEIDEWISGLCARHREEMSEENRKNMFILDKEYRNNLEMETEIYEQIKMEME